MRRPCHQGPNGDALRRQALKAKRGSADVGPGGEGEASADARIATGADVAYDAVEEDAETAALGRRRVAALVAPRSADVP